MNVTRSAKYSAAVIGMAIASLANAGDVTDSDLLLCYGWSAAVCDTESVCEVTEPWRLNMPDFVTIDLDDELITSVPGEVDERESSISSIAREGGYIIMQGMQDGRAFSWLITENTGEGTLTVSTADRGIVIFTVCMDQDEL
jgi:hypothetical protein